MKISSVISFLFLVLLRWGHHQSHIEGPSKMVLVPGNDEIESFYMDQYELTIAEFAEFVEATGYVTEAEKLGGTMRLKGGTNWEIIEGKAWNRHTLLDENGIEETLDKIPEFRNHPVMHLAPSDVQAYANWVNKRIPTLQEWMHAVKAGQKDYQYAYPGGNDLRKLGWYEGNTDSWFPMDVGTKMPNELGIYDLVGNAAEVVLLEKGSQEFQVRGGTFFSSKMFLEPERKAPIGAVWNRPLDMIGIRLVKDVQ
ncbi:SUMF1/EgtB/PvdO family nonheme iron enzyme [Algoriphagus marincola]|uniref:SUMF1/EgtB/PvdO family nonheme iron enzyme n=1 Tax=Algoriphagus marincola TaxID=264027 RepID=UPI00068509AC|nr:SUMF1/EgtB/PvdO family nonheme iron enzyme [Algoriphagus marincola]